MTVAAGMQSDCQPDLRTGYHDGGRHADTAQRALGPYFRRPLGLLLRERTSVQWVMVGALGESLLGLATPWLSAFIIDTALPSGAARMLAVAVCLAVIAALNLAWMGWLRKRIMISLGARIEAICLEWVLERFLHTPFSRAQHASFGDTNETMAAVSSTTGAVVQAAVGITAQVLSVVATLALVGFWFPELAAMVVLAAVLMTGLSSLFAVREASLSAIGMEAASRQQQTFHVLLRAVATLRVSGATDRFAELWSRQLLAQTQASIAQDNAHVSQSVVFSGFPQLIWLGAIAWLVHQVMGGDASLGQMMMGVTLVGNTMGSFVGLAKTGVAFQAMRPEFERIDRLLAASEGLSASRGPSTGLNSSSGVELDGVFFKYDESGRWVLENERRSFPHKEVSVLRAASGSGKTTTLRLIAGLLKPNRGTVRVLDRDPHRSRELVTYLPQRSTLLEASIATNLRVLSGRPLTEALAVAEHTGLARLLESLPMGVDTLVSVAGSNLSAGQRQLVLLTAAFASGRPVILLDEATSQLDAASEAAIDWRSLVQGRTVIMVLHD